MESDRVKWNKKFSNRSNEISQPDPFVVRHAGLFNRKTILDLASGDGRNSIYLASQGYEVTAADISEVALDRLQSFAQAHQVLVKTHQMDLDQTDGLRQLGTFDNLLMNMFKPPSDLWEVFPILLAEGGIFMLSVVDIRQHEQHGFPREYCVEEGEYLSIAPPFEVVNYEKEENQNRYLSRYIFVKK